MAEPISKEELIEILDDVLNKRRTVADDIHQRHHEYIEMELERRELRMENWRKFKSSFIGGLALAVLSALIWLGTLVIAAFKAGNTHP